MSAAAATGAASLRGHRLALLVVWAVSAAYLLTVFDKEWIPHDEGVLSLGAERVLAGELPHRDFDSVYTGGLEYLHGAAFALLGHRLLSLRILLLVSTLAFIPVFYSLTARFFGPLCSASLVLTALLWSIPNYFAPLPSWYLLFLATFALAALLRGLDTGRRRWLFSAGLCGGLAFVVKSVGGGYIAAAGAVALLYDEQQTREGRPASPGRGYLCLVALFAAALVGGLLLLVRRRLGVQEVFHFVLPGAALAGLLLWGEATAGGGPLTARAKGAARRLAPFGAGLLVPIALFLVPYAFSGSLGDFLRGVFVLPRKRLDMASLPLFELWTFATAVPMALLLFLPRTLGHRRVRFAALPLAVLLAYLLVAGGRKEVYLPFWMSVRPVLPLAVVAGCLALARREGSVEPRRKVALLGVLATAAFLGLNQYPYPFAVYFCYAAPFAVLAAAAAVRTQPASPGRIPLLVIALAFHALFGVRWLLPGSVRWIGHSFVARPAVRLLPGRAGIGVPAFEAVVYETVLREVGARSAPGDFIYAAPDCPEIYFLADRRNPTRTMYDFFDDDWGRGPARARRILEALAARGVKVVVINHAAEFSGRLDPELHRSLAGFYPGKKLIGNFTVMWRA